MAQAIQLIGAFLILIAYALAQLGMLSARGVPFLLLNLAGALILAGSAYDEEQWGFLVLEVAWAAVSAAGASAPALGAGNGFRRAPRAERLALPVPVERALHLHEPDDRRDDEDPEREEPESRPAAHRRLTAVLLVHVPDLGRNDERHDGAHDDPDDEAEHAADPLAGVLLHLFRGLVDPVQA